MTLSPAQIVRFMFSVTAFTFLTSQASAAPANLATGGTASASSELGACCGSVTPFFASRAIDGNRDGSDNSLIFHTNNGDNPLFWQVDLGADKSLDRVEIFPRTNALQGTVNNFRVTVKDSSNATVFSHDYLPSNSASTGWGTADLRGVVGETVRFERIDPTTPNFLTFSEFEVWGQSTPVVPNLLRNAPATAAAAGYGTAIANGNDGDINGNYGLPNSIYHSVAAGAGLSWQATLPGTREIDRVNIYARQDGVTTTNVRIAVLDEHGNEVTHQDVNLNGVDLGAQRYDVPVTMPAHTFGSAVKVTTLNNELFAFGELEAFSSIDPGKGISYAGVINHDNPAAYYRLDDVGTTAVDSSPGGAHPGTYTGTTTSVAGVAGNAAEFNGSPANVNATVSIAPSFTAEVWGRSNTPTWNTLGWLGSARAANGFIIHPDSGTGNVTGYVLDSSGNYTAIGTVTPNDITKYHQYAISYDSSNNVAHFVLDGVTKTTANVVIARTTNAALPLTLGEDPCCGGGRYGNGALDEFALYNSALPTRVLSGHYYSATVLNDVPTTYYKFEDASSANGATVADSALGNGTQIENGTYTGSGIALGAATAGNAVHFDGTNYVLANNVPINDSFTAEVWGKSDTALFNAYGWLGSDRGANGFIIHPNINSTSWGGYILDSSGTYHHIGDYNAAAVDDKMHQYVVSYDAATQIGSMFFDGVLVGQLAFTGGLAFARTAGLTNIYLGNDGGIGGADRFGKGTLDEFALYPYALSAIQVQNHFLAMVPEPSSITLAGLSLVGIIAARRRRK